MRQHAVVILTAWLSVWLSAAPLQGATAADREFVLAYRLFQQSEKILATEAFESFLRGYPHDARSGDAGYYLALLARDRGNLVAAVRYLDRGGGRTYVATETVALLRGQIVLESGDGAAAIAVLEPINRENLPNERSNAMLSYLLGAGHRQVGNLPAAAAQFRQASAEGSIRAMALLELGRTEVELKETAAALHSLDAAAREPAVAAEARSLAAEVAYAGGQYDLAAQLYQQIIEHHSTYRAFKPALIGRLRALLGAAQPETLLQQHAVIKHLLDAKNRAESTYLCGIAEFQLERYAQAAESLSRFVGRVSPDHELAGHGYYMLAVSLFQLDRLDDFERVSASFIRQYSASPRLRDVQQLLAQAAIKRRELNEAIKRLGPLIDAPGEPHTRSALLQRAALYDRTKQHALALTDYLTVMKHYASHPSISEAQQHAIGLAFRSGQFDVVVSQARPYLLSNERNSAINASIRLKLAIALIKLQREIEARDVLAELLEQHPHPSITALARYYQGLLLAAQDGDKIKAAIDALQQACNGPLNDTHKNQALRLLAELHRRAGQDADALATFERLGIDEAIGEDVSTTMWIGRNLHRRKRFARALPYLEGVAAHQAADRQNHLEATFLAAECYKQLQNWNRAIPHYRRLVERGQEFKQRGRLGLAQCFTNVGDVDGARREYRALFNVDSSRVAATALWEAAELHLQQARDDLKSGNDLSASQQQHEARRLLSRVTILYNLPQLQPMPQRALLTLGLVASQQDDIGQARRALQQLTDEHPKSPWADLGRAELALLDGRRGDALFLLRQFSQQDGDDLVAQYAQKRLVDLEEVR